MCKVKSEKGENYNKLIVRFKVIDLKSKSKVNLLLIFFYF
jgi:hypothetical protein